MAWSIGLHLGENIVEIAAKQNEREGVLRKRSFGAYHAPEQALNQFLQQNEIQSVDKVSLLYRLPLQIIESLHGSPPAVLTTSGFEDHLDLQTPLTRNYFKRKPKRVATLTDRNLIFGVNERVLHDGKIEKPIEESDLEFLASKLELLKCKTVAVCLHSNQNPKNENKVAEYLSQKGFLVFSSSQFSLDDERVRFRSAIASAYIAPSTIEFLTKLKTVFDPLLKKEEGFLVGGTPVSHYLSGKSNPLLSAFDLTNRLATQYSSGEPFLYCGLEEFLFMDGRTKEQNVFPLPFGNIEMKHQPYVRTDIQPLSIFKRGFFSELSLSNEQIRFDPGPMILGRGQQPTYVDLLSMHFDFSGIDGFSEKIQEKSKARLLENLSAYCKNIVDENGQSLTSMNLSQYFILHACRMFQLRYGKSLKNKTLKLSGPLATVIAQSFKMAQLNIRFEVLKNDNLLSDHALDVALADGTKK